MTQTLTSLSNFDTHAFVFLPATISHTSSSNQQLHSFKQTIPPETMSSNTTAPTPLSVSRHEWTDYLTQNLTAVNKILPQVSHDLEILRINLYLFKQHASQAEDGNALVLERYDADVEPRREEIDRVFRARLISDAEEIRSAHQTESGRMAAWVQHLVKNLEGIKEAREELQRRLAQATAEVESSPS